MNTHRCGAPLESDPWQRNSCSAVPLDVEPPGSSTHRVMRWSCRWGLKISTQFPDGGMTSARAVPVPAMAMPAASPIAASMLASLVLRLMSRPPRAPFPRTGISGTVGGRPETALKRGRFSEAVLVAEFAAAAGDEVVELGADRVVHGRRLELGQLLAPDLAGPGGGVLGAQLEPALEVRGGGEPRTLEAVAEPFHGVLRAEEVPAVADLLVRAEREGLLGDLQRSELDPQLTQQFDVDDELLVAADQAALQPAGRVHDEVGAGQERRQQRHQRLVRRLGVGRLRGVQPAAGPERQPV